MCKESRDASFEGYDKLHEQAPKTWLGAICRCGLNRKTPYFSWVSGIATTCTQCGKTEKWRLQRCGSCSEFFLKDFVHPAYCVFDPECWVCLQASKIDVVDKHGRQDKYRKVAPVLGKLYKYILNPVEITDDLLNFKF